MTSYIGILEKEPTSLWGIWFPDLPGCVSAAETSELVLQYAPEALDLWLADSRETGVEAPRARSVDELRRDDPYVAEALAKGDIAVLIAPRDDSDQVLLGRESIAQVDEAAAHQGITRHDFVRRAIIEKIAS